MMSASNRSSSTSRIRRLRHRVCVWRARRQDVDCGVPASLPVPLRITAVVVAVILLAAGAVLGYIAAVAIRRSEGVFLPAGYVAVACLAGGALLLRLAIRG